MPEKSSEELEKPRVFVLNRNPGHDYKAAKRYGRLVFVTEGKPPIFTTDRLLVDLDVGLAGFREQEDFVLLSGNVVLNALGLMLLAWRFKTVQLLLHDAKAHTYHPRTISETVLREQFRAE